MCWSYFQRIHKNLLDTDGDSYYTEYIGFLEEKVAEQRRLMREQEEAEKQARIKAILEVRKVN